MSMCWINGEIVAAEDLRISPFDHGFLYGLGFFETFRTYKGNVLFLSEHYKRLGEALNMYRITMPYTVKDIEQAIATLTEEAGGQDGYFRLNVSAGVHDIGLSPTKYEQPTVILFRKELIERRRGEPKTASWLNIARNTPEQAIRMKSHHYGNNVLGRFEMPSLAHEEGFFVTEDGFVSEGITSNIFWIKDNVLYTPSVDTGLLPGITRAWVLSVASHLGYDVEEGRFKSKELRKATECFITNSVQEIVPISKIGVDRYLGEDGPVYNRFHQAYIEEILSMLEDKK